MMATGVAVLILWRRQVSSLDLLGAALIALFLLNPLSALTPGFRLSFAAVFVLFLALRIQVIPSDRWRSLSGLTRLVSLQWFLLFALSPITITEFGRMSLVAPFVNLLVLPVFSFVTVPGSLLGMLLDGPVAVIGDMLIVAAHRSVVAVLWFLEQFGSHRVTMEPAGGRYWVSLLTTLFLLLPAGWPGRGVAFVRAADCLRLSTRGT